MHACTYYNTILERVQVPMYATCSDSVCSVTLQQSMQSAANVFARAAAALAGLLHYSFTHTVHFLCIHDLLPYAAAVQHTDSLSNKMVEARSSWLKSIRILVFKVIFAVLKTVRGYRDTFDAASQTEQQQQWTAAVVAAKKDSQLDLLSQVKLLLKDVVDAHAKLIVEGLPGLEVLDHDAAELINIGNVLGRAEDRCYALFISGCIERPACMAVQAAFQQAQAEAGNTVDVDADDADSLSASLGNSEQAQQEPKASAAATEGVDVIEVSV